MLACGATVEQTVELVERMEKALEAAGLVRAHPLGVLFVPHVPAGQGRLTLLPVRYAMFGLTPLASVIITTHLWYRLTQHGLGPAAALTIHTARRHLPFSLTWWSFTFPVGTVVTGTSALAPHSGSTVLGGLAVVYFAGLVAAWVVHAHGATTNDPAVHS